MIRDDWHGCYNEGWQGLIVPDAFAHPAKFSRALIVRIYDHMREEGWLPPGSTVLDPFGGVALGALDAMRLECSWVGLELEEKFVKLGTDNIALWNRRFGTMPNWGEAVLLHGDSRQLLAWNFAGPPADAVMGSPPFAGTSHADWHVDSSPERMGKLFENYKRGGGGMTEEQFRRHCEARQSGYGDSPSNLGNLPDKGFEAAIGSPPWAAQMNEGGAKGDPPGNLRRVRAIQTGRNPDSPSNQQFYQSYGSSPGQLAAMPEGAFEGVVSSPPWGEGAEGKLRAEKFKDPVAFAEKLADGKYRDGKAVASAAGRMAQLQRDSGSTYGGGEDNLGNTSRENFWLAARQILEQVFLCVKPGGHAVWVVKAFVRKGQRVDFPGQWAQLCEAVGFRVVHWHRAWLVEDHGTQGRTDGGETRLTKEKKSFFRRLAEKKGSPRIDWEDVLCLERV